MANDEATLLYYDAEGQHVDADDPSARRQYLSDDPARPDAPERSIGVFGLVQGEPAAPTLYYDADGAQVPEGDARAVRQFSADDKNRPDASKAPAEETDVAEAPKEPAAPAADAKAQPKPTSTKARTSSANK